MFLKTNNKYECYGCKACEQVCPTKSIQFTSDSEGFEYPTINKSICTSCNLCNRVCPYNTTNSLLNKPQSAYVGTHNDKDILFNSSSGGAFSAIGKFLLNKEYVIFGAKWTKDFHVVHDAAYTEKEFNEFRKSKYILSDTNTTYSKIKKLLLSNKNVMFSGTPCQCAGLKNFLSLNNVPQDNLVTVDIICHGAPNHKIFNIYLQQNKYINKISKYKFKNKKIINKNLNTRTAEIIFKDNSSKIVNMSNDSFLRGYYLRLFYRPSCKYCSYTQINRVSDITIGDAWGVQKLFNCYNTDHGISLILINTQKGAQIFQKINNMNLKKVNIQWAIESNEQLRKPTKFHKNRNVFFKYHTKINFNILVRLTTYRPIIIRLYTKFKHILSERTKHGNYCRRY